LFLFSVVLFLSDHALLQQLGQLLKLSHIRRLGRRGCLDRRNWRGWGCCGGGGRLLTAACWFGLLRPFFAAWCETPPTTTAVANKLGPVVVS
jgi:hypothetical protein